MDWRHDRKQIARGTGACSSPGPRAATRRRLPGYFMVGMENSTPSLTPAEGQRWVTVLRLV